MLQTPHTHIQGNGPATRFAALWEQREPMIPSKWGGRSLLLSRTPEASMAALRHPALQRTWQLELALGPGVLASPNTAWKEGRGVAKNMFTAALVPKFCSAALASLERREATLNQSQPIDLLNEISRLALGAFTIYAFGDTPSDEEWDDLLGIQQLLIQQVSSLNFPTTTSSSDLATLNRMRSACIGQVDKVINGMLERCIRAGREAPEFFKRLNDAEADGSLAHSTAASQVRNVLVASFLTTGILLTNSIRESLLKRGFWESLRDEAESAPAIDSQHSAEELQRPLATAAVDETARLFPAVWFVGREAVEDLNLVGTDIQKGTLVHTVLLLHQRDPELWSDPLEWKPERFLSEQKLPTPVGNLPFLTGRHVCLGKDFARAEATILLSELARRYDPQLSDPMRSTEFLDGTVLAPTTPLRTVMEQR